MRSRVFPVCVGGSHDEIEVLVSDFRVSRNGSVDKRLYLTAYRVEINGCGQHYYVGRNHFVKYLSHVVLLHALVGGIAGTAAAAVV